MRTHACSPAVIRCVYMMHHAVTLRQAHGWVVLARAVLQQQGMLQHFSIFEVFEPRNRRDASDASTMTQPMPTPIPASTPSASSVCRCCSTYCQTRGQRTLSQDTMRPCCVLPRTPLSPSSHQRLMRQTARYSCGRQRRVVEGLGLLKPFLGHSCCCWDLC
jgi:hypothetical protein